MLAHTLFNLGELAESARHFDKAIALEENPENIVELKRVFFGSKHFSVPGFFQGAHAPERHVFMSAAMDLVSSPGEAFHILEIGSYAGSSLLTWANAAEKLLDEVCHIVCVDTWGDPGAELFIDIDYVAKSLESQRVYQVFCHNASLCEENVQVTPIKGKSCDILPTLDGDLFDLIFIDGSHYCSDVLNDITESTNLLKPGGIICGDDLELQLSQCDQRFVIENRDVDFVKYPKSSIEFHPGVTLAVADYFGDVSCFSGFWAMRHSSDGFEKVSFEKATGVRPAHWPDHYQERITAYFDQSNELGQMI